MTTLKRLAPFVLALCALAAGLVCIAYGYALHTATVLVEGAPPGQPAPPPDAPPPVPPEEPPPPSWMAPPQPPQPLVEPPPSPPAKQPAEVGEWDLVRDATVGGIKRTADGRLERTYTGGPARACPT
jgi:hypothetical protein